MYKILFEFDTGMGLLGVTLRYPHEVHNKADYFGDIPDGKIPKEHARAGIVDTKGLKATNVVNLVDALR